MKIVICVNSLTGGGAERVASLWLLGFVQRGYDVSVILNDKRTPITYTLPPEVVVYYLGFDFKLRYLTSICNRLFFNYRLKRALARINPDISIGVMYRWGEYLLKYKNKFGYKIIQTEHNSFERPSEAPMSKIDEYLKFEINKYVDAVTVLTEADKVFIGNRLNNVFVLPNPLALKVEETIPSKQKIILAVGRLDAWHVKGFDVLIKAWAQIQNKAIDWKLRIIGHSSTGAGLDYLNGLCNSLNIKDSVEFVDFQTNIQDYYKQSEIFVLSSRYEGFGMVLIEAMSQGCACVACDYGGRQKEIIRNESEGLLCPTDDVESLANSIIKLISDEEYRKRIQKESLSRSKDFQINIIMNKWENIIRKTIKTQ